MNEAICQKRLKVKKKTIYFELLLILKMQLYISPQLLTVYERKNDKFKKFTKLLYLTQLGVGKVN